MIFDQLGLSLDPAAIQADVNARTRQGMDIREELAAMSTELRNISVGGSRSPTLHTNFMQTVSNDFCDPCVYSQ